MNTLKKFVSIALTALLMTCAGSFTASAQFKGIGNKLKNKAETVVKNNVDDKKSEVKNEVTPASENSDESFDYNKKYTASPEAIAAAPLAASSEVKDGYTKSVGKIHAFYENV